MVVAFLILLVLIVGVLLGKVLAIYKALLCLLLCIAVSPATLVYGQTATSECTFTIADGTQSLRRFTLTEAVFRCMKRPGYRSLAIINGENKSVPFDIGQTQSSTRVERYWQALSYYAEPAPAPYKTGDQIRRIADLTGVQSDNEMDSQWQLKNQHYSSILLEQKPTQDKLINLQLNLTPPDSPLSAVLLVEASDDLQHWTTVLGPYHLYSLPAALPGTTLPLQNHNLPIKSEGHGDRATPRYLRIAMLSNLPDLQRTISNISGEFQRETAESAVTQWLKVGHLEATDAANQWTFHLPGWLPISRVRLNPAPDITFYQGNIRVLRYPQPLDDSPMTLIQGRRTNSETEPSWRWVTNFKQYLLQTENGTVRSGDLVLNPVISKAWKLTFKQPSIDKVEMLPSVELGWVAPHITFLTQGPGPYRLLTDADQIPRAPIPRSLYRLAEDAETVQLVVDRVTGLELSKRPGDPSPDTASAADGKAQSGWPVLVLWLFLGLGVLIMGFMAYRLNRERYPNSKP